MSITQDEAVFSIGSVSSMTGVNAVTLRAWERRYGLIQPKRTDTGHRVYSNKDIQNINNILALLDEGISISRVRDALLSIKSSEKEANSEANHWEKYTKDMLLGVNNFDEQQLEAVYNEAMSLYPVDIVTRELIIPLLQKLGQRWTKVSTSIAEEHFFSSFMRNKLGARFHHRNQKNTGAIIIAACLPGETHEFGLLLLSLAVHEKGYKIILLGADMPLQQISEVVHRTGTKGVLLSGSIESKNKFSSSDLKKLVTDSDVPVCVGGKISEVLKNEIEEAGAHAVGDDFIVGLRMISKLIPVGK